MLALSEADARAFAQAITTCLTTLDALPRDWQQRAIDILKAAYPDDRDVKQPPPGDWALYQKAGGQISGTLK